MTRRSKRELERDLADLVADLVEENDTTSEWTWSIVQTDGDGYVIHPDGDPVPTDSDGEPNPPGYGPVVVLDGGYTRTALGDTGDT